MPSHNDAIYVFDLDGVITNPDDSSVDHEIVDHLYAMLEGGAHIAVNTGRSYEWVGANLVNLLAQHSNPGIFARLYIVCEKGGESRT